MHTDAAHSIGKVPVNVRDLGADLLSVAGHKLYAPKGVGVLYVGPGVVPEKYCHADSVTVSHVLVAMKVPEEWARGTV